jgi:large subunit ribosomal protein L13
MKKSKSIIIDVTGKGIGRAASQIAHFILGKHSAKGNFHRHEKKTVVVVHADKMKIPMKKLDTTYIFRSSGHPGSVKRTTRTMMYKKNPRTLLLRAIKGMLPQNTHTKESLKHIIIQGL